jgi:hypothetical protein
MPPLDNKPKDSGSGPVVATIIIVILLVIGALYFWGTHATQNRYDNLPLIPASTTGQ